MSVNLNPRWYEYEPKCVCGNCEVVDVVNAAGTTVRSIGTGPCFQQPQRPEPPAGLPTWFQQVNEQMLAATEAARDRAVAAQQEAEAALATINGSKAVDDGWTAPIDALAGFYEHYMADPETEIWRARIGWWGRLHQRGRTITKWWRPFRRYAEYRASYVHLRWMEQQERTRVT